MGKRKAVFEFTPNPDNPEHQILYRYLSSLDAGISGGIMQAVKEKFMPPAMIMSNCDRFKVELAEIESSVKLTATVEINRRMVAVYKFADSSSALQPESTKVSFASEDEDDDWDTEMTIPANDIQFAQDK
jgi:hypothetical protein